MSRVREGEAPSELRAGHSVTRLARRLAPRLQSPRLTRARVRPGFAVKWSRLYPTAAYRAVVFGLLSVPPECGTEPEAWGSGRTARTPIGRGARVLLFIRSRHICLPSCPPPLSRSS